MRAREICSIAAAWLVLGMTTSAAASPDYPTVIQDALGSTRAYPCTLCHASSSTKEKAVTTDFGRTMLVYGMVGANPASLVEAIRRNTKTQWDSDGDGVSDIEELIFGNDPNALALTNYDAPAYGCSIGKFAHRGEPARSHLGPTEWRALGGMWIGVGFVAFLLSAARRTRITKSRASCRRASET